MPGEKNCIRERPSHHPKKIAAGELTGLSVCRFQGCQRIVSRAGYCRPHFVTESLRWTITSKALRLVPFGRLSELELDRLRRETKGGDDDLRILRRLREIAPEVFPASTLAEHETAIQKQEEKIAVEQSLREHAIQKQEEEIAMERALREMALEEPGPALGEYDPMDALRRDQLGLLPIDLALAANRGERL